MFISNFKSNNMENYYVCNSIIGKYLVKNGVPLLSRIDDKMVFVRTSRLQKAFDTMPFYLKIFVKEGVLNG